MIEKGTRAARGAGAVLYAQSRETVCRHPASLTDTGETGRRADAGGNSEHAGATDRSSFR